MGTEKRIGLRQVRALKPGEIVWDASVPGFGARRQRSEAVSYVLFYRTTTAASAGSPLAGTEHLGHLKAHGRRLDGS